MDSTSPKWNDNPYGNVKFHALNRHILRIHDSAVVAVSLTTSKEASIEDVVVGATVTVHPEEQNVTSDPESRVMPMVPATVDRIRRMCWFVSGAIPVSLQISR